MIRMAELRISFEELAELLTTNGALPGMVRSLMAHDHGLAGAVKIGPVGEIRFMAYGAEFTDGVLRMDVVGDRFKERLLFGLSDSLGFTYQPGTYLTFTGRSLFIAVNRLLEEGLGIKGLRIRKMEPEDTGLRIGLLVGGTGSGPAV